MTRRGIRCSDCGAARLRKCETWRTLVSRGVGMDGAPLAVEEARTVVPARGRGSKQMAHEILRGATKDRVRRCPASSQGYPHVAAYRVVSRHSWNHGLSRHRVGRVGGVEVSPFLKADAEPIAGAARVGGGGNVVRLPLSAAASNRSMACRARPRSNSVSTVSAASCNVRSRRPSLSTITRVRRRSRCPPCDRAQRCWPRHATLQGQCGSSLRQNTAAASHGGCRVPSSRRYQVLRLVLSSLPPWA